MLRTTSNSGVGFNSSTGHFDAILNRYRGGLIVAPGNNLRAFREQDALSVYELRGDKEAPLWETKIVTIPACILMGTPETTVIVSNPRVLPHTPYVSLFETMEDVVHAWALAHIPLSGPQEGFRRGREWGTNIYRCRRTNMYMFGTAMAGTENAAPVNRPTGNRNRVGLIHTHPFDFDAKYLNTENAVFIRHSEQFSWDDVRLAHSSRVPNFLATPTGRILRTDPVRITDHRHLELGELVREDAPFVTLIIENVFDR